MDEQNKPSSEPSFYKSNYFTIPLAIIIAGAMISGAVLLSNNKNQKNQIRNLPNQLQEEEDLSKIYSVSPDDDPRQGEAKSKVTIIEFSDFQCPFCKKALPTVKKILKNYQGQIEFVYRDFPLDFHKQAQNAAEAAQCANEQNKFWEYHDLLFEKQNEWAKSEGLEFFKKYAQELKLEMEKFNRCLEGHKYKEEVEKDLKDGEEVEVSGTPTFFINGRKLTGARSYEEFKKIIDEEIEKQKSK